ncbi:MAG: 30S ribosomal protein S17e [Candidatus Hadarchaeum sp.]|uniref:30S ribosomal protein S17e n=1 Tax=Candidatus Hadarchaeum sp. TaxID=2883567 RepID=UPI003181D55C
MGSVRSLYIKRAAREILEKYPNKFTKDFSENARILDELIKTDSKTTRNRVAGYITKIMKRENGTAAENI